MEEGKQIAIACRHQSQPAHNVRHAQRIGTHAQPCHRSEQPQENAGARARLPQARKRLIPGNPELHDRPRRFISRDDYGQTGPGPQAQAMSERRPVAREAGDAVATARNPFAVGIPDAKN